MPKVSKDTATLDDHGPVQDWHQDVEGYTINFVRFNVDVDGTPMLKGLPGDHCNCPHWGYVLSGRLTFRFPDHEEVFEPGDAFYLPAGHIPTGRGRLRVRPVQPGRGARPHRRCDAAQHGGDAAGLRGRRRQAGSRGPTST